jgi:Protein of unknown function (DUF1566)/Repeat of unknown function (DUF5648)
MKLKNGLISLLLVLLSSCGGQNSPVASNGSALKTATTALDATPLKPTSDKISLMDSLAVLYPNGKPRPEQAAAAAKFLAQNPPVLSLTAPEPQTFSKAHSNTYKNMATFADYQLVARIQNTNLFGAYFFSIYDAEIENALNTNPDWLLEGAAFWASLATGDGLSPVHRFRNLLNGSYLYTIYEAEKSSIISNYSKTFTYEGVSWYARQTQAGGWTPLYRFRNLINGTYLFTAYEDEKEQIQYWYDDIFALEGVAYYVRLIEPPPDPVVTSIAPLAATVGIPTIFFVSGTNLPLDSALFFANATCSVPVQRTATGFTQTCTPSGPVGVNNASVKTVSTSVIVGTKPVTLLAQTVEPVYTGNLPDTGITNTQCYGAGSDVLISCTSPAAVALNPKQDGMVGRDVTASAAADGKLGFSYSDVPKPAGGVYAKTECVKDNITGLTWEGKTTSGIRNNVDGYTNYDSTLKAQKWDGSNQVNPTQADIDAMSNTIGYKNYVNSISLCGYTDWRLPAAEEFEGLFDAVANPYGYIDTTWFPNTWGTRYWTSTENVAAYANSQQSFYADAYDSKIGSFYRDSDYRLRLVRGGTSASANRYSYTNNGTEVVDSKTKLTWRRCEEGMAWNGNTCIGTGITFTHEQALSQSKTQTGWRLPNRKELTSIQNFSRYPAIDPQLFPSNVEYPSYWSSSPNGDYGDSVWSVSFYVGAYLVGRQYQGLQIRLVRNSP